MGEGGNEHGQYCATGESPPCFHVLVHLFFWGKVAIVRLFWLISGSIIMECYWVGESGNVVLY
jgi:hypothetical protein